MAKNWDNVHFENIDEVLRIIQKLYNDAIRKAVKQGLKVKYDPETLFTFDDAPKALQKEVDKILRAFHDQMVDVIDEGTNRAWLLSGDKNDELVRSIVPAAKLSEPALKRFMGRNLDALLTFQTRKSNGLNLSDRVWNITKDFKNEIELALDIGLSEGKSANEIAKDVRQYLNEPDKLFRRVRDKNGKLQLSKAAKQYKPGTGVYRSSRKNAQRLTRTEINMAYREADHDRWQDLDFVVGYEVRRSNNTVGCDICSSLVGRYPKTFKFRGFHPNCKCNCITILASKQEMDEIIDKIASGGSNSGFKSKEGIYKMPENYTSWVKANEKKLLRAKNPAYWIKDNYKDGDLKKGLKYIG